MFTGLGTPFSAVSSSAPDGGLLALQTKINTCLVLLSRSTDSAHWYNFGIHWYKCVIF